MNTRHPTPLKFLGPGWFAIVMGLCGLSLAWHRATPLLGEPAAAAALAIGVLAAAVALVLAVGALVRWQRYPQAWAEDVKHPVRHPFVAAMPIAVILLATVGSALLGPSLPVKLLWMAGAVWQFFVTVWALGRWLQPGVGGAGGSFWPAVTPALFIPVVGNVLLPLAGVPLGLTAWAAAQFGLGLLFWPVVLTLLAVRIGVSGLWPERLLPATFITIAPPAVVGLSALQLGAPPLLGWLLWGMALFFVAWSAKVVPRMLKSPFAVPFWGLSFPLAAFAALTLRLAAPGHGVNGGDAAPTASALLVAAPAGFQAAAMLALALACIVIAGLLIATVKGLRDGTLLAPEPVASIVPGGATVTQ